MEYTQNKPNCISRITASTTSLAEDQAPPKILDDSKLSVFLVNIQSLTHKTGELFLVREALNFPAIVAIT